MTKWFGVKGTLYASNDANQPTITNHFFTSFQKYKITEALNQCVTTGNNLIVLYLYTWDKTKMLHGGVQ